MIVMPPEERARRIQEDKKIMAALSEKVASMRKQAARQKGGKDENNKSYME